MSRELFGTDGIRGVPGRFPLDDATVYATGRALGEFVPRLDPPEARRVLIGIDTRESGQRLAGIFASGLQHTGAVAVFAGVMTTPGIAALVRTNDFGAGVVISASHNPFTDNGIKLFSHAGMKFPDAVEETLEQEILAHRRDALEAAHSWSDAPVPPEPEPDLRDAYLELLRRHADGEADLSGLVIVLDCANGAASRLAPELFASLGARVILLHASPDGRNINAGCGSLHPEIMRRAVVKTGAHLGVSFDGDADRAIFATARGHLVDGDGVLWIAAKALAAAKRLKGGAVVGTAMTNLGLERSLGGLGIHLERVPVGDRYVLEELLRRGANLGGEPSGHIIFLDDSPAGDGMQTALKVAAAIVHDDSLESLLAGLTLFPQRILNIRVVQKPPLESLPEVTSLVSRARESLGAASRLVLRYSGTEHVARVMVEAEDEAEVDRWSETIAEAIRSAIGEPG